LLKQRPRTKQDIYIYVAGGAWMVFIPNNHAYANAWDPFDLHHLPLYLCLQGIFLQEQPAS
jgi:hypothetical protein